MLCPQQRRQLQGDSAQAILLLPVGNLYRWWFSPRHNSDEIKEGNGVGEREWIIDRRENIEYKVTYWYLAIC